MKIAVVTEHGWGLSMYMLTRLTAYSKELKTKYPSIDIHFSVHYLPIGSLNNAPTQRHRPGSKNVIILDHKWMEKNIAKGKPYDATILLLNRKQAKEIGIKNASGCHYKDKDGHGDIWIVADEKQTTRRKEGLRRKVVPAFEETLDHELKHYFCHLLGIKDTVHEDNYDGKPDRLWKLINEAIKVGPIEKVRQMINDHAEEAVHILTMPINGGTVPPTDSIAYKIYNVARLNIGFDVTPQDYVPDEVACAETVNALVQQATGEPIGGGASTYLMYAQLALQTKWKAVEGVAQAGDIIISPTGHGNTKVMPHGHVGIMLSDTEIGSNDSRTGKFEKNFTLDSWNARYKVRGGYPVFLFRRK